MRKLMDGACMLFLYVMTLEIIMTVAVWAAATFYYAYKFIGGLFG